MSVADLPESQTGGSAAPPSSFMALADLEQEAIDAIPVAVYLCASDGRVIRFNNKAVDLWGRTPRLTDPGERFCGSFRLYRTDGTFLPRDECPMATALETGESFQGEVVVERPDGERLTVLVNIASIMDQDGRVNGAVNCFQDISARKLADEQRRYVVHELNHRIKNLLATVHSMATFTARDAESINDFSSRFEARLVALSRAQALLSECEAQGASLLSLLKQQLEPFGAGENMRVRLEGPDVDLQPPVAMALCMVFHELMTNAAKYGALSIERGRLSIMWRCEGDRILALQWVETGGPPVESPRRAGFGTQLIRRTIAGLGGDAELAFELSGFQLRAEIPLRCAGERAS